MKNILVLLLGVGIVLLFWFYVFKVFPIGVFLAIIGAVMATHNRTEERSVRLIGAVLSWLYPIGIIYTFIHNGFLWGVIAIIAGFFFYKMAK